MSNFEFSFTINQENASFSQENSFSVKDTLTSLKEKLDYKSEDFSDIEKEVSRYFYLIDLMYIIPTLKFKNEEKFWRKLKSIIHEFPVKNNNKVRYGIYFTYFNDFRQYIYKEFGLLPKNRVFWQRFWVWLIILFLLLSTLTASPLFGGILSVITSPIFAQISEKNKRKEGIVLGLREISVKK